MTLEKRVADLLNQAIAGRRAADGEHGKWSVVAIPYGTHEIGVTLFVGKSISGTVLVSSEVASTVVRALTHYEDPMSLVDALRVFVLEVEERASAPT